MEHQVLKLFPEIADIQNPDLRSKVIACWAEAMSYRDWTIEELRSIPFTLLAPNVQISFIEHVRTCTQMAVSVDSVLEKAYGDRRIPVNRDYLIAGCLLADVGKLFEYAKHPDGTIYKSDFGKNIRHPFSGVGLAFKHGIPPEVMHIIAVHSKEGSGEKRSAEAIIFHHVDFIDFDLVRII